MSEPVTDPSHICLQLVYTTELEGFCNSVYVKIFCFVLTSYMNIQLHDNNSYTITSLTLHYSFKGITAFHYECLLSCSKCKSVSRSTMLLVPELTLCCPPVVRSKQLCCQSNY
jgi:hypothetical protein